MTFFHLHFLNPTNLCFTSIGLPLLWCDPVRATCVNSIPHLGTPSSSVDARSPSPPPPAHSLVLCNRHIELRTEGEERGRGVGAANCPVFVCTPGSGLFYETPHCHGHCWCGICSWHKNDRRKSLSQIMGLCRDCSKGFRLQSVPVQFKGGGVSMNVTYAKFIARKKKYKSTINQPTAKKCPKTFHQSTF